MLTSHRCFRRTCLVALCAVIGGFSCRPSAPQPAEPVVASVDSDRITRSELDSLAPAGFEMTRQNLPKILDKWVSNTLMYQEAIRRGIQKEPQVQAQLKRLERDFLVNALLERLTASAEVPQEEIMDYYNTHKDEFSYEVKITRIILQDSLLAAQTLKELQSGADFKKLAGERSEDVLLKAGEESRYFSRGVGDPRAGGDPRLEEVIFSLKPGEISGVIPTQEGFQIVKLVDKKKTKADVSYSEARDYISAILSYRHSQMIVDSTLKALRGKAKIEVRPDAYFEAGSK